MQTIGKSLYFFNYECRRKLPWSRFSKFCGFLGYPKIPPHTGHLIQHEK